MARDGFLPASFAAIDARRGIPMKATIAAGVLAAIVAGVLPIGILLEAVSVATLVSFVAVCAAVIALRYREPAARRPFRAPWSPLVPIGGIVFSVGVALTQSSDTRIRLMLWLALGMVVYFVIARKSGPSFR